MYHLCVFGTVLFTVYGQLVIKWQVGRAGEFPAETAGKLWFLLRMIWNPWVLSGLAAAFLAFLCWMAAMTKFELSYAYPFMSLAFVLVLVMSGLLFREPVTMAKVVGILLIVAGIVVGSR